MPKPTVLIICTGNACRSQMAEGILRAVVGDLLEVCSAGSRPAGYVDPLAIKALAEIQIDISGHRSKDLKEFLGQNIETVITVCSSADKHCPVFPGQVHRLHWPFRDPGHAHGTEEQRMVEYRRIRDKIRLKFERYATGRRQWLRSESAAATDI